MSIYYSVIIAKLKRYIIVVGIPHIAAQTVNRFIGNVNIKECVDVSVSSYDEYNEYNIFKKAFRYIYIYIYIIYTHIYEGASIFHL